MKTWEFTYTENKGDSFKTIRTTAETFSKAYIETIYKIPKEAIITDKKEIETIEE